MVVDAQEYLTKLAVGAATTPTGGIAAGDGAAEMEERIQAAMARIEIALVANDVDNIVVNRFKSRCGRCC